MNISSHTPDSHKSDRGSRRHAVPLMWGSGAVAAVLLVLGVNGTLSSWTTAIITNTTNTAGAADAIALAESDDGGSTECADTSTDLTGNNSATCNTINKYGGNTTMSPGDSEQVDVTFANTGTGDATTFGYTAGTCTDGSGGSLCSNGDLTVAVSCVTGDDFASGTAIPALANTAAAPSSLVATTGAAVAVASGDQVTCRFTTTLASTAPASDGSATVSQPITWTLSA